MLSIVTTDTFSADSLLQLAKAKTATIVKIVFFILFVIDWFDCYTNKYTNYFLNLQLYLIKFSLRDSNSNLDIQNVSSCQLDERKVELCTGIEPIYPDYKSGASPAMLTEL
jgi:hypothetical protein